MKRPESESREIQRDYLVRIAALQNARGRALAAVEILDAEEARGVVRRTATHRLARMADFDLIRFEGAARTRVVAFTDAGKRIIAESTERVPETPPLLIDAHALLRGLELQPVGCSPLAEVCDEPICATLAMLFPGFCDDTDRVIVARGDSMEAPDPADRRSIHHGDWIHIRTGGVLHNGRRQYVEYDLSNGVRECTVKIVEFRTGAKSVTLRALNPAYDDMVRPAKNIEVRGEVLAVRRLENGRKK